MKFSIQSDVLKKHLKRVVTVVPNKTTLPIITHILCEVKDGKLNLTGTDLEIGLSTWVDVDESEDGKVCIPAKKFSEIVRELEGEIQVTQKDYKLKITCDNAKFTLLCLDADDYPQFVALDEITFQYMSAEILITLLNRVSYAVAGGDMPRYGLGNVYMKTDGSEFRCVATDGHRLVMAKAQDIEVDLSEPLLLPREAAINIPKLISGDDIEIGTDKKNFAIRCEDMVLTVRMPEAEYPDYTKVIPEETPWSWSFNRERMIDAVKRVALMTTEHNRGITFQITNGSLTIESPNTDLGQAVDVLDCAANEEGNAILNPKYFLDALSRIDTEGVQVQGGHDGKPLMLYPQPRDEYFHLVMPMRK